MKKCILSIIFIFTTLPVFTAEPVKDIIIINSNKNESQTVTAPALKPSKASELRDARKDAEVSTESHILEKLESERLKDEQKRISQIMGNSQPDTVVVQKQSALPAREPEWYFGERAFISFGAGVVNYLGGDNINSTEQPALFISLGGYTHERFIFDFIGHWSKHFIDVERSKAMVVHQFSGAFSLKFSPLKGKLKPYGGVVASYTGRRYCETDHEDKCVESLFASKGKRRWQQAVDLGPTIGMDVALGSRFGLNVGLWWLFNIYTEEIKQVISEDEELLSEKQSLVLSGNVRFYF